MKKTLIIVLLVAIVALGAYLFFAKTRVPAPAPVVVGQTGTLPSIGNGQRGIPFFGSNVPGSASSTGSSTVRLGIVSRNPTSVYRVNSKTGVTLVQPDGEIFTMSGVQALPQSTSSISGFISSDISIDGTKIVVLFASSSKTMANVFDVITKKWFSLPAGVQSPQWSPTDDRLAYVQDSADGTETLFTVDFGKSTPTAIPVTGFYMQDGSLSWLNANQIMIGEKPTAYSNSAIFLADLKTKTLTLVIDPAPAASAIWQAPSLSPLGLLFSSGSNGLGGSLRLVDASGNSLESLTFLTLPSKCTFAYRPPVGSTSATSSQVLYLFCAVPRDQATLTYYHLPDDYEQGTIVTSDDIYQINTQSGFISTVFNDPNQSFDVGSIRVQGGKLYFVNRYDGNLYAMPL